jgi:polyisoprenoid-binding protein YceI
MAQAQHRTSGTELELPRAGKWAFDANHTKFGFTARHLMVTKVRGHFAEFDGSISIGERPEDSSVNVVVKMASVDTSSPDRDKHLRSEDFFDVDRYPEMTFRSTKVERAGDAGLRITGDLTIRDVTRPVTFEGEFEGMAATPWGSTSAGFSATAEIDREDWGLTWNVALESGGWLVSKKVEISIDVEIVPVQSEVAA